MNAFTFKKSILALSLCFAYTSFSHAEELESRVSSLESRMGAVKTRTAKGTVGAKMATARPLTDGYGLFFTGDFLCWHLKEGEAQYVLKNNNASSETFHGSSKQFNFNWDFGFRLGAGYNMEHDEWDANLYFTWFQTEADKHAHAGSNGILYPEVGVLTGFTPFVPNPFNRVGKKAKIHWNVGYYVLDLELGRNFFVSKFLSFRPKFGIETAWINQNMHFDEHLLPLLNSGMTRYKLKNKNNYWGMGPRFGVESSWYFCESFGLFGNLSGALLWGRFKVDEKENSKGNSALTKLTNASGDFSTIVPNAQMILGFQYDVNFNDNSNHIGIKLGYEFQYWWKQNQMLCGFVPDLPIYERESADLSINGVTLDVRFDF